MSQKTISHSGFIKSVLSNRLEVSIISQSACVSCQVKGACSVADTEEKVVDVDRVKGVNYAVGDHVVVEMDQSSALRAVMLGYFFPFLLLIIVLFVVAGVTHNEGLAGLVALASLVPYYLVLWWSRKAVKKSFQFRLKSE